MVRVWSVRAVVSILIVVAVWLIRFTLSSSCSRYRFPAASQFYVDLSDSSRAARLLVAWPASVREFRVIRPKDEVRRIEAEAEGTEHDEADADRQDTGVAIP